MAHTHQRCFPCLLYISLLSSEETPTQNEKKLFCCAVKSVNFCSKVNADFWQPIDGNVFNTVKVSCCYSKDWKWMSAQGNYYLVFCEQFFAEGFWTSHCQSLEGLFLSVADLPKSIMQRKLSLLQMRAYCRFQHSNWNPDSHMHRGC